VETLTTVETYVLDSWPIMEWLQGHPASVEMDRLLETALKGSTRLLMSRINLGEIYYSCWKFLPTQAASYLADLKTLPIDIFSVDDALVDEAAHLKAQCSAAYADCFAAALAIRHSAPVITGDNEYRKLAAITTLKIHWVGE